MSQQITSVGMFLLGNDTFVQTPTTPAQLPTVTTLNLANGQVLVMPTSYVVLTQNRGFVSPSSLTTSDYITLVMPYIQGAVSIQRDSSVLTSFAVSKRSFSVQVTGISSVGQPAPVALPMGTLVQWNPSSSTPPQVPASTPGSSSLFSFCAIPGSYPVDSAAALACEAFPTLDLSSDVTFTTTPP